MRMSYGFGGALMLDDGNGIEQRKSVRRSAKARVVLVAGRGAIASLIE
jgi:hypothetical protein